MLVTASMVNAVLYCERLLYLRSKNEEDPDNYYLADGRAVHQRVDDSSRALHIYSEQRDVSARMDVVDIEGGAVDVIEYKRGETPPAGPHLPERAQLCAQTLVLRDSGFVVRSAAIYYAGSKRRVPVEITDELIAETERAICLTREVIAGEIPPPLVDSPKCSGCSMIGICLPDEVNLLNERGGDLRQMRVDRDEGTPLHVQEQGARVGLRGEQLVIRGKDGEVTARLTHTSDVNIYGGVQISSQAMRELMYREIPVMLFTTGGWYVGRAVGNESKNVELRRAQYRLFERSGERLALSRRIVVSKIKNCRTMLRRNAEGLSDAALRSLDASMVSALAAETLPELLGVEGAAARVYFSQFSHMLRRSQAFDFERRNRRPPRDPVNALLSLAYALLVRSVAIATAKAGLDPLFGFYHEPRAGRPALALDLMEDFRPIIADSVVLSAINTAVVTEEDFVSVAESCALTSRARKKFIACYERRLDQEIEHPVFEYRCSYRRVFEIQARLLGRFLTGEISAYPTFNTR